MAKKISFMPMPWVPFPFQVVIVDEVFLVMVKKSWT
jgi:hypothetical protein